MESATATSTAPTRAQLKEKIRAKVNNSRLLRAPATVKQEKIDKMTADLDKILEPTGMTAGTFIKRMMETGE